MSISTKSLRLRHYGSDAFDPTAFAPVKDRDWIKADGGLWTSPVTSSYGWRHWCQDESYSTCDIHFDIDFRGRVFTVDALADLMAMPWIDSRFMGGPAFEAMIAKGIDAIHLTVRGQEATRFSQPRNLYGWDCETVYVMNPQCLKPLTPA